MLSTSKIFVILLVLFSLTVVSGSSAQAQVMHSGLESSDSLEKLGKTTRDANKFIQELVEKIRDLDDYYYESEVFTYPNSKAKPKVDIGKFYFKKENRIRVESSSGKTSGSIVVRRKDGLIRAKAGPMLLGITMTLHENSSLLNAGDGTNVIHSDLLTQMVQLRSNIKSGCKGLVTAQPTEGGVMVLDVYENGQDALGDRIIISATSGLPLQLIHYNKGEVFARTLVKNLKINSGIADNLFEI